MSDEPQIDEPHVDELSERKKIPFFYNSKHYLYDNNINDWTIYMHPVNKISGNEIYIHTTKIPIGRTYKQDLLKQLKIV